MIHVKSEDMWPPPNWTEVVVTWDWIMAKNSRDPNDIYNWACNHPGGRFHLHGYKSTEGFAYRFERPIDATWFQLNLPL